MAIPIDLKGKGWWVWYIPDIEGGDVVKIVDKCIAADISHLIIKIANGIYDYGINDSGFDMAKALVDEIHARAPHMKALGWTYTYAAQPEAEAGKAIERIRETGVDMFVVDAESQYKTAGGAAIAQRFMSALRAGIPDMPVFLASYRYPSLHPEFPWSTFRNAVDGDMPQVYWEQSHNPSYQLNKSYAEFIALTPKLPYIPIGSAYKRGEWQATPDDVTEFLEAAYGSKVMPAANFWEWGRMALYVPGLWQPIANFSWPYYELPGGLTVFSANAQAEVASNNIGYAKIDVPADTMWCVEAIDVYSDRATENLAILIADKTGRTMVLSSLKNAPKDEHLCWNGSILLDNPESVVAECSAHLGTGGTTVFISIRGYVETNL